MVEWVDVSTRKEYRDIVLDSIRFCQAEKGLVLHSWCLMSNHLHLVVSAKNEDLSNILRDFKKFTSKQIIEAIICNKQESRGDWMLRIFKEEGSRNSRNKIYQFWRQDNQPKELYSPKFVFQKINYIHNNPVESGIVENRKIIYTAVQKITMQQKNAVYWMWFSYNGNSLTAFSKPIRSCKLRITMKPFFITQLCGQRGVHRIHALLRYLCDQ